ncbi:MAG TPA: hypothetical protein VFV30_00500, partial [Novosphingobium sp.]|nr:hypothetical protein [Novosphingobium sp.]
REYGAEPLGRAIAESRRAVEIAPDYGFAQAIHALTIAGAYLSLSPHDPEQERAIQPHIDRAFALDPDHAGVLAAIAAASAYIGRPAEGLPRALRAIRLRPGHGLAHYAAGVSSLLLSAEDDALGHFERFLQVEPESHLHYITHAWRGICRSRLHEFPAAREAFADSFALFPGNFIARLVLTCIDCIEGHRDQAADHLAAARALEPIATLQLYQARIGRFFAGSALRGDALAALGSLWPEG